MNKSEFKAELRKLDVMFTDKVTKWGSEYWTIDGSGYRHSDHRKPEGSFTKYIFGENDFAEYSDMIVKVRINVEKKNITRHLSYDDREVLGYGQYLESTDPELFNTWINHHPNFYELKESCLVG